MNSPYPDAIAPTAPTNPVTVMCPAQAFMDRILNLAFYALDETAAWTAGGPEAGIAGLALGPTVRTELSEDILLFERQMSQRRVWAEFSASGFARTYRFKLQ